MKWIIQIMTLSILAYALSFVLIFDHIHSSIFAISIAFEPVLVIFCMLFIYKVRKKSRSFNLVLKEANDVKACLSHNNSLIEKILQNSSLGMAITSVNGSIVQLNDVFSHLVGIPREQLMMMYFQRLFILEGDKNFNLIFEKLKNKIINSSQFELQWRNLDGELLYIDVKLTTVFDRLGEPTYILACIKNNTEQMIIQNRLDHVLHYDSLTGLSSSHGLYKFANQLITDNHPNHKIMLIAADIDNFKSIVGTLGYDTADSILKLIAERMKNSIGPNDLVARLSGDKFVIVIAKLKKLEIAQQIIHSLNEASTKPINIGDREIYITLSAGVSIYPDDGKDIKTLMKNADIALHRAKESGRNNFQNFHKDLSISINKDFALHFALSNSLWHDEFMLHYQPKFDVRSLQITGVEAFLRWKNTQFQDISSDQLIQVAIDAGLILPVSDWIKRTACEQLKEWRRIGLNEISIAINCSLREIHQRHFADKLVAMCNEANIPPHLIEVEFKESDIIRDAKFILDVLHRMKNKGITIVIDNYGNGQCSLKNLKKLSLDKIKINNAYINQLLIDDVSSSLTATIIQNANKLGIKTIASKVESKEQYDFLSKVGCSEIQGYYIQAPVDNKTMTDYLLNARRKLIDSEIV